jgi:hypothetical protein
MRGADRPGKLFSYASPESWYRGTIRCGRFGCRVNAALDQLLVGFAAIYADTGRSSIPPEKTGGHDEIHSDWQENRSGRDCRRKVGLPQ